MYRGLKWISFDEGRPTLGVEEDIFKLFVSGGSLCLRKNHEAETHFADWPRRGKSWAMNPDDVPRVPSATESAYRRRIQCVRMRAWFSAKKELVDPASLVFQADDTLRDWLRGGKASIVFWSTILMPIVRKSSRLECEEEIRLLEVQISEDTEWLVRKMTRKPVRDLPTEAEAAPVGSSVSEEACGHSARIGRETHICAFALDVGGADMWAAQIFKMSKPPSNYGVKTRRRANDRRPTRIEVIDNAIGDYPYLIRKVEGQKRAGNPHLEVPTPPNRIG